MTTRNVFENIESAHEYVGLLCEALDEAAETIGEELVQPSVASHPRREDALRLVEHKLATLHGHLMKSRLLLNDLRTLRRYLLQERELVG
ncbi:MAG: hypothetical protein QM736_06585 [Vicinamibacterales bacterium]